MRSRLLGLIAGIVLLTACSSGGNVTTAPAPQSAPAVAAPSPVVVNAPTIITPSAPMPVWIAPTVAAVTASQGDHPANIWQQDAIFTAYGNFDLDTTFNGPTTFEAVQFTGISSGTTDGSVIVAFYISVDGVAWQLIHSANYGASITTSSIHTFNFGAPVTSTYLRLAVIGSSFSMGAGQLLEP